MDISKSVQVTRIEEINILHDIRLINHHDLNPRITKDNLTAQFHLKGDVKGSINCYLCLDDKELTHTDRNYLLPVFMESMNILIGQQISLDPDLHSLKIDLSTPKMSLIPTLVNTSGRESTHLYQLQLNETHYDILVQYALELVN